MNLSWNNIGGAWQLLNGNEHVVTIHTLCGDPAVYIGPGRIWERDFFEKKALTMQDAKVLANAVCKIRTGSEAPVVGSPWEELPVKVARNRVYWSVKDGPVRSLWWDRGANETELIAYVCRAEVHLLDADSRKIQHTVPYDTIKIAVQAAQAAVSSWCLLRTGMSAPDEGAPWENSCSNCRHKFSDEHTTCDACMGFAGHFGRWEPVG